MEMNNKQTSKNQLTTSNYVALFILFTAFFVACTYIVIRNLKFLNNSDKISATVVDVHVTHDSGTNHTSRNYHVYVSYTYDGKFYDSVLLDGGSSAEKKGDIIIVNCNRNNPEDVRLIGNVKVYSIIYFVMVGVVLILTIYAIIRKIRKNK